MNIRKASINFIGTQNKEGKCAESWSEGAVMAEPASQASMQPRLQQAQSSGTSGSNSTTGSASGNSDPARPGLSQQQWASQKKAQVRAFPRAKKLEKLGVFSACKVWETSYFLSQARCS